MWLSQSHQSTKLDWNRAFQVRLRVVQSEAADKKKSEARFAGTIAPQPKPWAEQEAESNAKAACKHCHGSGMEVVPGRGARPSDHKPIDPAPKPDYKRLESRVN